MSIRRRTLLLSTLLLAPTLVAAQSGGITVSPFASYIPSAANNPLAGLALTFGGSGLALRAGAEMSISNAPRDSAAMSAGGYKPWGADVDAMLILGGLGSGMNVMSRGLTPYLFAGIGMTGSDSAGSNLIRHGWSYGAGASIPLGFAADIFAEARWRMPEYVLPTSNNAPDSKSSFRFGLSFHVGGSPNPQPDMGGRRGRGRYGREGMESDDGEVVVVRESAPPVIVVQEQPQEPEVVVVNPDPPITREPEVIYTEPTVRDPVIVRRPPSRRGTTVSVPTSTSSTDVVSPARTRPPSRVVLGRSRTASSRSPSVQKSTTVRGSTSRQSPTVRQRSTATQSTGSVQSSQRRTTSTTQKRSTSATAKERITTPSSAVQAARRRASQAVRETRKPE